MVTIVIVFLMTFVQCTFSQAGSSCATITQANIAAIASMETIFEIAGVLTIARIKNKGD